MKRAIIILFILNGLTNSFGQELDGVWMSYNNRTIEEGKLTTFGDEGFFLDFDNNRYGHLLGDSTIRVKFNKKQNKLISKRHGLKIKFKRFGTDSLELDSGENTMYVFRKLDLSHKLKTNKKEIERFLIENKFDSIQDFKLNFTSEQYMIDVMRSKPFKRFNLLANDFESPGQWFISEINRNFFLVLTLGQLQEKNIFQIQSIDNCRIKLIPLQDGGFRDAVTELKTCLHQGL